MKRLTVLACLFLLVACGRIDFETGDSLRGIRGGDVLEANEYPSVVRLYMARRSLCSGTLIRSNVVLTAAHCVDAPALEGNPGLIEVVTPAGLVRAQSYEIYPSYAGAIGAMVRADGRYFAAIPVDLALVSFPGDLGIKPCTVFPAGIARHTMVTVVGYGQNEDHVLGKRMGDMEFHGYIPSYNEGPVRDSSVGALAMLPGSENSQGISSAICKGDSGGPAFSSDGRVIGVASSVLSSGGYACSRVSSASYVNATQYRPWINSLADAMEEAITQPKETFAWTNPNNRYDVSGDGWITPMDILVVINYVNSDEPSKVNPYQKPSAYYDVNGDGWVNDTDSKVLTNYINANGSGPAN